MVIDFTIGSYVDELSRQLNSLRKKMEWTDCCIETKSGMIPVHHVVMNAVIEMYPQSKICFNDLKKFVLENYEKHVVEIFVSCLYTGRVVIDNINDQDNFVNLCEDLNMQMFVNDIKKHAKVMEQIQNGATATHMTFKMETDQGLTGDLYSSENSSSDQDKIPYPIYMTQNLTNNVESVSNLLTNSDHLKSVELCDRQKVNISGISEIRSDFIITKSMEEEKSPSSEHSTLKNSQNFQKDGEITNTNEPSINFEDLDILIKQEPDDGAFSNQESDSLSIVANDHGNDQCQITDVHIKKEKKHKSNMSEDKESNNEADTSKKTVYKCIYDGCGKQFSRKSTLKTHEDKHTNPFGSKSSKHQCKICSKIFHQKYHLIEHMYSHSKEKEFSCVKCHKQFRYPRTKRRHEHKCCGQKPEKKKSYKYVCDFCGAGYNKKKDLANHIHSEHEDDNTSQNFRKDSEINNTSEQSINFEEMDTQEPNDDSFSNQGSDSLQTMSIVTKGDGNIQDPITDVTNKTKEKIFQCMICRRSFLNKFHLTEHMYFHSKKKEFSCEKCHRQFTYPRTIRRHLKECGQKPKKKEPSVYVCDFKCCGAFYDKKKDLAYHIHSAHKKDKTSQNLQKESEINNTNDSEINNTNDSDFNNTNDSEINNTNDSEISNTNDSEINNTNDGEINNTNDSEINNTIDSEINNTNDSEIHNTNEPSINFEDLDILIKQEPDVHDAFSNQESDSLQTMSIVTKGDRNDEGSITDVQEDKEQEQKSNISEDKESQDEAHTTKKTVYKCQCEGCGKQFFQKSLLKTDGKKYTNQFPYWCKSCSSRVTSPYGLVIHCRKEQHVKSSRGIKHQCTICSKIFHQKYHLTEHMYSHSTEKEFSCVKCHRQFKYARTKRRHEKECGQKPEKKESSMFMCDICGAVFDQRNQLTNHIQRKHEEPSFQCSQCGQMFRWKNSLKKHTDSGKCTNKLVEKEYYD